MATVIMSAFKDDEMIASDVIRGDCFFKRLVGLSNKKEMKESEGCWLMPCNQIHTYGMSFPIDVLFLSKDGEILEMQLNFAPQKISKCVRNADSVLELCANRAEIKSLKIGDKIRFITMDDKENI